MISEVTVVGLLRHPGTQSNTAIPCFLKKSLYYVRNSLYFKNITHLVEIKRSLFCKATLSSSLSIPLIFVDPLKRTEYILSNFSCFDDTNFVPVVIKITGIDITGNGTNLPVSSELRSIVSGRDRP